MLRYSCNNDDDDDDEDDDDDYDDDDYDDDDNNIALKMAEYQPKHIGENIVNKIHHKY
jgi:hypothetical protein